MPLRAALAVVFALALAPAACGEPGTAELLAQARSALRADDFPRAARLAEAAAGAARAAGDAHLVWTAIRLGLEALASTEGEGLQALDALARAAEQHPERVGAVLYVDVAARLADAGDVASAIAAVERALGQPRFEADRPRLREWLEHLREREARQWPGWACTFGYL